MVYIITINNVEYKRDLPNAYLEHYPHMYRDIGGNCIWIYEGPTHYYAIRSSGDSYHKVDFERITTIMNECCERLSAHNKLKAATVNVIEM